jgi:predicted MPP superfamily phosphohydrolase
MIRTLFTTLSWLTLLSGLALAGWALWRIRHTPQPQRSIALEALLVSLGFAGLDALLLFALPRLEISFGSPRLPLVALLLGRGFLYIAWVLTRKRNKPQAVSSPHRRHLNSRWLLYLLNLALLGVVVEAFYIEPTSLSTTTFSLPAAGLEHPLRIAHLSDLHIERTTARERKLAVALETLQPDLVLFTGDYLKSSRMDDPAAIQALRDLLATLHPPYGIYAVRGNVDDADMMQTLFSGLPVTILEDAAVPIPGLPQVYLLGIPCCQLGRDRESLAHLATQMPAGAYQILLYHTPDLIESAAADGINLYLAGHTHGGQIRLPFYGAVFTFSAYGKRYEMGRYQVSSTTLYVNRGVGMEGSRAPQARFLCPPEVLLVEVPALPRALSTLSHTLYMPHTVWDPPRWLATWSPQTRRSQSFPPTAPLPDAGQ